mmetsp:Transcript_22798/g.52253  ORF Transcript_22798/g.52253 Transcript_22798/m.52253 type:complete len:282 (-) Transcript_22798:77-922(-)
MDGHIVMEMCPATCGNCLPQAFEASTTGLISGDWISLFSFFEIASVFASFFCIILCTSYKFIQYKSRFFSNVDSSCVTNATDLRRKTSADPGLICSIASCETLSASNISFPLHGRLDARATAALPRRGSQSQLHIGDSWHSLDQQHVICMLESVGKKKPSKAGKNNETLVSTTSSEISSDNGKNTDQSVKMSSAEIADESLATSPDLEDVGDADASSDLNLVVESGDLMENLTTRFQKKDSAKSSSELTLNSKSGEDKNNSVQILSSEVAFETCASNNYCR